MDGVTGCTVTGTLMPGTKKSVLEKVLSSEGVIGVLRYNDNDDNCDLKNEILILCCHICEYIVEITL